MPSKPATALRLHEVAESNHPKAPETPQLRAFLDNSRATHLEFGRRHLGWGVFVLRPTV